MEFLNALYSTIIDPKTIASLWDKLFILFSLVFVMIGAEKAGIIKWLTKPLDYIKDHKLMLVAWFLFSMVMSAFFPNGIVAAVVVPIAVLYCDQRKIDKTAMLLSLGIAIVVGNSFLPTGGGGNLLCWGLLEKKIGHPLSSLIWFKMMFWPAVITMVISIAVLWKMVYSKLETKVLEAVEKSEFKFDILFFINLAIFAFSVYAGLFKMPTYYVAASALALIAINRPSKESYRKIPWKAIIIYFFAIVIGNATGDLIKHNPQFVDYFKVSFTFWQIIVLMLLMAFCTNFLYTSALIPILFPTILAVNTTGNYWMFAFAQMGLNLAYMTILANTALTITAGYGADQKKMFNVGFVNVILQLLALAVFFYFTKGAAVYNVF